MKGSSYEIRVTYQETDMMGVVYYGNYLRWFEIGRTEYLREKGMSYKEFEDRGILLPVLESHCNYHSPARYDDLVTIKTKISKLKRTKIEFDYEIIRSEDGELIAIGSTVHPFVGSDFKPISLKKKDKEIWNLIEQELVKSN
ncbi:acyl-CoA thioesterase [Halonatronum saccharophilum]|uniref:acyl-CoA thioesterase n=1 Tax=Halonatronum saccharophilum TaxID=150060 RepID=UPI00047F031E|nr:thioesterase family protein [Halonatronum saccharophilum]